ncbi:hypothetical protein TPHA_0G00155 [Tetrapisispora phaffii CBS 4417]|uniref:Uncharacterized protein n=1 Tax=Tetrapisispora phaffii (strain ATCC 24235 / CBS 4417 / NBRC 1672 / NRRL Y-8282 / UCD 70-5) TaxID=1071381 RepID=G8BVC8_TETPH|nr:hypothetical protein TPHA_0G00155 [Tetrapisispora phaffii CBS 4417]CCE63856.1 hypothetical protein TPHA_0G00155 [Tetrapisispora phaffii CBS 4417]
MIGAVSWKLKLTCASSTEAELYAISESIPRIANLSHLITEICGYQPTRTIYSDSQSGIASIISKDAGILKNKFYGIRLLKIIEETKDNGINIEYVNTKENIANILTKPVETKTFKELTCDWIS